jgi:A/G-specific adenine glycosylase
MLRKTTATQVAQIYSTFIAAHPTWESLALAQVQDLEGLLRPLGIADRARLLRLLAIEVVSGFAGQLPVDTRTLLRLPGVGRYTASAVQTFAYDQNVALVDSNVIRVLGRVFGWWSKKQRPHLDWELWTRAQSLVPRSGSRQYHYALLDFGALVCKARKPLCWECPLARKCQYMRSAAEAMRKPVT